MSRPREYRIVHLMFWVATDYVESKNSVQYLQVTKIMKDNEALQHPPGPLNEMATNSVAGAIIPNEIEQKPSEIPPFQGEFKEGGPDVASRKTGVHDR